MTAENLPKITPDLLLHAYSVGVFPMSEGGAQDEIFWVDPEQRGIIPLDKFHISHSLAKRMRKGGFSVAVNTDFMGVLEACADRPETWINKEIFNLYMDLHHQGHAHSLEVWADGRLIGGVYGVAIGAAFFGESMFSRQKDGSKIALAYLVERLQTGGFTLFDTQFLTDHLASMGAVEISRNKYHALLDIALNRQADFWRHSLLSASVAGI
jgi:leucyl/phenylalanyl-tRNA---protein transferase